MILKREGKPRDGFSRKNDRLLLLLVNTGIQLVLERLCHLFDHIVVF